MKNDPVQERQLHYAYQTIHDLLVAGTLLKENLKRLRDAGIEGGSDMQDEVNAINAWDKACKENNLTWHKVTQDQPVKVDLTKGVVAQIGTIEMIGPREKDHE